MPTRIFRGFLTEFKLGWQYCALGPNSSGWFTATEPLGPDGRPSLSRNGQVVVVGTGKPSSCFEYDYIPREIPDPHMETDF